VVGRLQELDDIVTTSSRQEILKQEAGIRGEEENRTTCATDLRSQLNCGLGAQLNRLSRPLTSRYARNVEAAFGEQPECSQDANLLGEWILATLAANPLHGITPSLGMARVRAGEFQAPARYHQPPGAAV
jgi:hypothetical protein